MRAHTSNGKRNVQFCILPGQCPKSPVPQLEPCMMQLTSLKVSTYAEYEQEPHFIKSNIFEFAPYIDSKQSEHLSRLYTAVFAVRMTIASTLSYRVSAHKMLCSD